MNAIANRIQGHRGLHNGGSVLGIHWSFFGGGPASSQRIVAAQSVIVDFITGEGQRTSYGQYLSGEYRLDRHRCFHEAQVGDLACLLPGVRGPPWLATWSQDRRR